MICISFFYTISRTFLFQLHLFLVLWLLPSFRLQAKSTMSNYRCKKVLQIKIKSNSLFSLLLGWLKKFQLKKFVEKNQQEGLDEKKIVSVTMGLITL